MTTDELRAKFEAWRDSLPAKHWARYDLSACKLGWDAAHASRDTEVEALRKDAERYRKMREIAFEYAGGIHWIGIDNDFKFTDYRFDLDKTVDAAMRE